MNCPIQITSFRLTIIVLLAVSIASVVQASNGTVRLSWDGCDPLIQNQNYNGPQLYRLVASASGSTAPNNGYRIKVRIKPGPIPEAWQFDETGCQSGRLAISHSAVSKSCPAYQGARPLGLHNYSVEQYGTALLDIANTYDLFAPSASSRYTLWTAVIDHAVAAASRWQTLANCSGVENPLCLVIEGTELLLADGPIASYQIENEFVIWQSPGNEVGCPDFRPRVDGTWGRVKGMFR